MKLWRDHLGKLAVVSAVALGSLTSVAVASWRVWHVDPLPAAASPYEWAATAAAANVTDARPANIDDVLDADPFRFGAVRNVSDANEGSSEPVVEQDCSLIGTVVGLDGGSFAMCDVGGAPRLVRQGQKIGAWTLLRVERARAVFRDKDGEPITLKVAQTGEVR